MVNWKEHGKDLLKTAGIVATGMLAWNYSPEIRDLIVNYGDKLDVCDVGRMGKETVKFIGEASRFALPVILPYTGFKISKKF